MSPSPEHTEEKVAIITGASQGIGAGLTKAYRGIGYAVIATARSIVPSEDPGIVTVEGDIADPDTAQRIVDEALERFGRIDTLVNNAGIYIGKPFTEYTLQDFNALVAVNVALKIALVGSLAQVGLAFATAVGAWINLSLVIAFAVRAGYLQLDAALMRSVAKFVAAGVVLGAALWLAATCPLVANYAAVPLPGELYM